VIQGDSVWCYKADEIRSIYSKFVEVDQCHEMIQLFGEKETIYRDQIASYRLNEVNLNSIIELKDSIITVQKINHVALRKQMNKVKRKSTVMVTLAFLVTGLTLFSAIR